MDNNSRNSRAAEPANKYHTSAPQPAKEPQRQPLRNNPRLVVGGLDYFELLMEQEEQQ